MDDTTKLWAAFDCARKTAAGIQLDGCASFIGAFSSINVTVLVPKNGSAPEVLTHSAKFGVLTGHDTLELIDYAMHRAPVWLSANRLLKKQDLISAQDWRFNPYLNRYESGSLQVYASLNLKRHFRFFHDCLIKHGKHYILPQGRWASNLFARVTSSMALHETAARSIIVSAAPLGANDERSPEP